MTIKFRLKIVIVGPSNVGKSAIMESILTQRFLSKSSPIPINIETKNIEFSPGEIITLSLWDICGKESFKPLRSVFYKGAAGALLVFDISNRQTLKKINEWLSEIRIFAGENIPFILVGNKVDLIRDDNNIRKAAEKLATEEATIYIETSAKNNTNIEKIFVDLIKLIIDKRTVNIINNTIKQETNLTRDD